MKGSQVIATGYNGTPARTWHPEQFPQPCPCQTGPSGANLALKYCAHAEANAIAQSAFRGASTEGAEIFCTVMPCIECVKVLITAGIKAIAYDEAYPDLSGLRETYLRQAGIAIRQLDPARARAHLQRLAASPPAGLRGPDLSPIDPHSKMSPT